MYIGCLLHFSVISAWQLTEVDSSLVLNFAFPSGLCSFHGYKELWNPSEMKSLTIYEENNPHDCCAVSVLSDLCSKIYKSCSMKVALNKDFSKSLN